MCAGANKALMGTKVVGWMMYGKESESLVVQRDCSKIEPSYTPRGKPSFYHPVALILSIVAPGRESRTNNF